MSVAIRQVTIRGRVQGVGYRYWVEQQATAHAVEGWVRNRRARVDAVDECPGSADALNLRRAGERFSTLPTI